MTHETPEPTAEWDKVFPRSDAVDREKVAFRTRFGITLVADLYRPKGAEGELPALAVAGPDGESTIVPVKVGGRVTAIDPPLPDPVPGTVHIVARVVAAQAPERDDLVWPDDLIRGDRGRVVGCRALGAAARPAAALTDQEITLLTAGGGEQEPEA